MGIDRNRELVNKFGVKGIPGVFLIDKRGKLVFKGHMLPDQKTLDKAMS